MSLSRAAARIAARYALLDATLAEGRVFDSAISPLDVTVDVHRKPLAIVMTDDDDLPVEGRDITHGGRECEMVIVIAVTGTTEAEEGGLALTLMPSDEGLDLALDLLEHQVLTTLQHAVSPWANAFRAMTPRFDMVSSRRGGGDEGVKFAARQIILTCDLIDVPDPGVPIIDGSAWDTFLAVAEAEADTAETAAFMRSIIEGDPLNDWERARRALGLDNRGGLGFGPEIIDDSDHYTLDRVDVRVDYGEGGSFPVEPEE